MSDCRWTKRVEMWFDQESAQPDAVAQHVAECKVCAGHVAWLQRVRNRAGALAVHSGISDAQFPAFLERIREHTQTPSARRTGLWAFASAVAAALIIVVATFVVISARPSQASATVIESATTELEGAQVGVYNSDNGTATVWVNIGGSDVL